MIPHGLCRDTHCVAAEAGASSGSPTIRTCNDRRDTPPGYQALLETVRSGKVDVVVAESLDRFSRDGDPHIELLGDLMALLQAAGAMTTQEETSLGADVLRSFQGSAKGAQGRFSSPASYPAIGRAKIRAGAPSDPASASAPKTNSARPPASGPAPRRCSQMITPSRSRRRCTG